MNICFFIVCIYTNLKLNSKYLEILFRFFGHMLRTVFNIQAGEGRCLDSAKKCLKVLNFGFLYKSFCYIII